MNTKGKKPKKDEAGELFYRTIRRQKFIELMGHLRVALGIPKGAFLTLEAEKKWYLSMKKEDRLKIFSVINVLSKDFDLPASLRDRLEEYLVGNGRFTLYGGESKSTCDIDWERDVKLFSSQEISLKEKLWRLTGQPYVKLYISDSVNQSDVKRYLDENWKEVRRLLDIQRERPRKRIREIKNKTLKEEVYSLSKTPIADLRKASGMIGYKNQIISKLVEANYGKSLSPESIASIIHEYKKLEEI